MNASSRVYWDAYGLWNSHSGIAFHARSLARAMRDLDCTPTIVGSRRSQAFDGFEFCQHLPAPLEGSFLRKIKFVWSDAVFTGLRGAADTFVLHGLSNFNVPIWTPKPPGARFVLTVHDVIPLLTGARTPYARQLRWLLPRAAKRADAIICISQWTKRTLLDALSDHEVAAKITVIPNGFPPLSLEPPKRRAHVEALYVARHEEYKNFARIGAILAAHPTLRIHLVTDARGRQWCERHLPERHSSGRLHVHQALSDEQLDALYRSTDLYLSLATYEGFCLPAAKAQACGKPVVYLSGSGIDEVVAPAASISLTHDATPEEWAGAIEHAREQVQHPEFATRLTTQWQARPSWSAVAEATVALYHRIGARAS